MHKTYLTLSILTIMLAACGEILSDGSQADQASDSLTSRVVRFVVLGDGGTGDAAQKKVADAVEKVCAQRGCEFALYLGDNIYNNGVASSDDAKFRTHFERPYAALDFPFYVTLGNHDYGPSLDFLGGATAFQFSDRRADLQIEYTGESEKWTLPDRMYAVRVGPVELFSIDTNAVVSGRFAKLTKDRQQAWLDDKLASSDARWKIVFGHHPYISNGEHGNAGNYDCGGLDPYKGGPLKELVEESVCGKAQLYFAGHDHDREWLEPTCGTTFIVSGAAAKRRALRNCEDTPTRYADGSENGFLWVEIDGDTLTGVFYDDQANVDYEDILLR
jgi:tartrate-resistant acid phosphatase type 5